MEICFKVLVGHCVLFATSVAVIINKQYREDYEYNSKTDAFYKLHIEAHKQGHANIICNMEGATLMVPSSNEDLIQAHGMMKRFPDIGAFVLIGADGDTHESAEEDPIIDLNLLESTEYSDVEVFSTCDVMTRSGKIQSTYCHYEHPFICKVNAKDVPYDNRCRVYGFRYDYYASVGSCYKIPLISLSWYEAYAECQAEGAHLVVLNSATERQAVIDLIHASLTQRTYIDNSDRFVYYAGIKAEKPDISSIQFRTIFNETLEEAGYDEWVDREPSPVGNLDCCGAINLIHEKYKAMDCRRLNQFVCEREVRV